MIRGVLKSTLHICEKVYKQSLSILPGKETSYEFGGRTFESIQDAVVALANDHAGYRRAYENASSEAAMLRDDRDRLRKALKRYGKEKKSLPQGLRGRQLGFMHIGKTAGTSVQHALFEALWDAEIFHDSLPGFDRVEASELAFFDLIIGHFMWRHVAKMRPDRFLFTFLRDPVDRVVSNYYFLRAKSPRSRYSEVALEAAQELSLKDFLLSDDLGIRMVTENFQTKALAYDIRPEHMVSGDDLLDIARRNLATFDFVGIAEHFDRSMIALSSILGFESPLPINKLNVNADRQENPAPSEEEIAIAQRLNSLDIQLYREARENFEREMMV